MLKDISEYDEDEYERTFTNTHDFSFQFYVKSVEDRKFHGSEVGKYSLRRNARGDLPLRDYHGRKLAAAHLFEIKKLIKSNKWNFVSLQWTKNRKIACSS